jgi:hypothetical protein
MLIRGAQRAPCEIEARALETPYERDFAVRLTFEDDKIIRNVVLPGGASRWGDT